MVVDELGDPLDLDKLEQFFSERREHGKKRAAASKPVHSLYIVRKADVSDGSTKKPEDV
jgi:hypothetical protein